MLATRGRSLRRRPRARLGLGQRRHLRDREGARARRHRRRPAPTRRVVDPRPRRASTSTLLRDIKERRRGRIWSTPKSAAAAHVPARGIVWDRERDASTSRCRAPRRTSSRGTTPRSSSPRRRRRRRGREHADDARRVRVLAARPACSSARARPRTPAASPPPRSRCSRTPPATRGASSTPRSASPRSWRASTSAPRRPPTSTASPGDYVVGANIAGFTRVADAMLALGVI